VSVLSRPHGSTSGPVDDVDDEFFECESDGKFTLYGTPLCQKL